MREVLVAHRPAHVRRRGEHERRRELVACRRDDLLVEVGERDDETDVVLRDEPGERRDIPGVVDAWDERAVVRVVQRRRERIEVGRDRGRAGASERADDVDALARAGEEDRGHLDVGG